MEEEETNGEGGIAALKGKDALSSKTTKRKRSEGTSYEQKCHGHSVGHFLKQAGSVFICTEKVTSEPTPIGPL